MTDPLRRNGNLVESLGSSLRSGGHAFGTAPALLRQLLEAGSWRDFVTQRGERVEHERFTDFVTTQPLHGLGGTVDVVRRLVRDDPVTLDLLDQALRRPPGGDRHSDSFRLDNIQADGAPTGTSREASLRRLRKDRPDLHTEVLAGRLSAHAAMVQAGFRYRTATIPVDDPERAAQALRRKMTPETLAAVVHLLSE